MKQTKGRGNNLSPKIAPAWYHFPNPRNAHPHPKNLSINRSDFSTSSIPSPNPEMPSINYFRSQILFPIQEPLHNLNIPTQSDPSDASSHECYPPECKPPHRPSTWANQAGEKLEKNFRMETKESQTQRKPKGTERKKNTSTAYICPSTTSLLLISPLSSCLLRSLVHKALRPLQLEANNTPKQLATEIRGLRNTHLFL